MEKEFCYGLFHIFIPKQKQTNIISERFNSSFCWILFVIGSYLLISCGYKNQSVAAKGGATSLTAVSKPYGVITTVKMMKDLKEADVVTEAAVVQSEASRYAVDVTIPDLKQSIRQVENAMSILSMTDYKKLKLL